jgi:hypothetical protein
MQIAKCKLQIEGTLQAVLSVGCNFLYRQELRNLQFAICNLQFAFVFSLFIWPSSCSGQTAPKDGSEAPLVGRQEPFCGAVGSGRFKVRTTATPTELQAGDAIRFRVTIESVGSWQHAPERPDFQKKAEYARFRENFHMTNDGQRLSPEQGTWEFDYSLRAKNERVKEIPSLYIVYFRPGLTPPEKGYMTTSAPAIPLRVTPRFKVETNETQGKNELVQPPDHLYQIVTGPEVLQNENESFLNGWVLLVLIVMPPTLSIGWVAWHARRNPDAARRIRLQKSRAGRQALQALDSLDAASSHGAARKVEEIVRGYLRHRFDVDVLPSALEANHGSEKLSLNQRARLAELLQRCDAIRYAPVAPPNDDGLAREAVGLILDWESQP